jgi:hypothetical protein
MNKSYKSIKKKIYNKLINSNDFSEITIPAALDGLIMAALDMRFAKSTRKFFYEELYNILLTHLNYRMK